MTAAVGLGPSPTTPRSSGRQRLRHGVESVLHHSRLGRLLARGAGMRGAVILMYHSVPGPEAAPWIDPSNAMAPEAFRRQMEFLAARREVVSLESLIELLDAGEVPSPGTVVLTFDDGYRDNLEVAAPILAELGLPAMLYLPTSYVTRAENQWIDTLYTAFRARTKQRLGIDCGGAVEDWALDEDETAGRAYAAVRDAILDADHGERERILGLVSEQLAPHTTAPRLTLTWDEVRELRERYPSIGIGGHTANHVALRGRDVATVQAEVAACRNDLERELGAPPRHFSFPYARFGRTASTIVREHGFRSAVAADDDVLVTPATDRYRLPRIEAPRNDTLFRLWTGGVPPNLPRRLLSVLRSGRKPAAHEEA